MRRPDRDWFLSDEEFDAAVTVETRLECLRLSVGSGRGNILKEAERYLEFLKTGVAGPDPAEAQKIKVGGE